MEPGREKLNEERNIEMRHFVAYHNIDDMGYEYEHDPEDEDLLFRFFSRKSINYLNKTKNNAVWGFSGKKNKSKKDYFLTEVYYPDSIYDDGDIFVVEGSKGMVFSPKIRVNDFEWFKMLFAEQNRFSLGINEIKDPFIIQELNSILKSATITIFKSPEEIPEENAIIEGAKSIVIVNRYERSKTGRDACIAHYGAKCMVCGFDFGQVYGDIGEGFIHVHHLVALSEIDEEYKLDPIKDLRPVCPNCHAMLHMKNEDGELLNIDDLRALLN
jgi:hypothetical protein